MGWPRASLVWQSWLPAMDTAPAFPTLSITRHPLIQHKLTILRDRRTPTKIFKELVDEIAMLMAYEATSGLQLEAVPVETPLEPATDRKSTRLNSSHIVISYAVCC